MNYRNMSGPKIWGAGLLLTAVACLLLCSCFKQPPTQPLSTHAQGQMETTNATETTAETGEKPLSQPTRPRQNEADTAVSSSVPTAEATKPTVSAETTIPTVSAESPPAPTQVASSPAVQSNGIELPEDVWDN